MRIATPLIFLTIAVSASSFAQSGRLDQVRNVDQATASRRGPKVDSDHSLMSAASQHMTKAQRLMKSALPIYDGHRHRAIEINRIALKVLRAAYNYNPGSMKPLNIEHELAKIGSSDESAARRYSVAEIAASNEKLKKAAELLFSAKSSLGKVSASYGGHVLETAQLIDLSLRELDFALKSVR